MSCGYEGSHFGAHYPDATCIDGYLWDLDNCDEPGDHVLHSGGDSPCPCCNTREYVEGCAEVETMGGNARQRRIGRRAVMRKVRAWAGDGEQGGRK
jgi:hypothetical protein